MQEPKGSFQFIQKRMLSIFESTFECLPSYKIANMIQFYTETLLKVMGSSAQLSQTMQEISGESMKTFYRNLESQSQDLSRLDPAPATTLEPPQIIRDCLVQLKEILVSHDMSLISSKKSEADETIQLIFKSYLVPMISICETGANSLQPLEKSIYKVNCFHLLQTHLSAFTFSEAETNRLEELISIECNHLIQEQVILFD